MYFKCCYRSKTSQFFSGMTSIVVFYLNMSCFTYAGSIGKDKNMGYQSISPKVYAIQTNVTDLDAGVGFYKNLGFSLISRDYFPQVAPMMNGQTMLVLHKVEKMTPTDPEGARTVLNMAVNDLDSMINEFMKKGITILHKEAQKAVIGNWKAICDPFGNIIHLIEPNQGIGDLEKPSVYNVSIIVTDIDRAVHIYSNVLGFDILSVKYHPVIPLRAEGAVTDIALHGSAKKNVRKMYPEGTQTFLVFQVEDLVSAMDYLSKKGVEFLHDAPQQAAPGIYAAFMDPFGLVHELLEIK